MTCTSTPRLVLVIALTSVLFLSSSGARADDCDGDGVDDADAIAMGLVPDCNTNGVPDSCDIYLFYTSYDFDDSGTPDECDIADGILADCNTNNLWDYVDVFGSFDFQGNFVGATSSDCDNNVIPDECESDCNTNSVPDVCDIREGASPDCNGNRLPDECDFAAGGAQDCNSNQTNDVCDVARQLAFQTASYPFEPVGGPGDPVNPIDVQIGDMNGDGWPDIVSANRSFPNPWSVGVFINQGPANPGTFAQGIIYGNNVGAESLALADLDGDGDLDVVTADRSVSIFFVAVYFNNGQGVLSAPVRYSVGQVPIHVVAADLDGDGDKDLVVADINAGRIVLMFNNGMGSFVGSITNITIGPRPLATAVADFNGDNKNDIAVCMQTENAVKILINNGNGTFAPPVTYPMGMAYAPTDIVAADLDGDGDLDLGLALQYSQSVGVMRNNGNGTFTAVSTYPAAGDNPVSITVGDYDGDGDRDLAVTLSSIRVNEEVCIHRNRGDASLLGPISVKVGYSPLSVTTGDLDLDGRPDLVVAAYQNENIRVLLNRTGAPASADANANTVPDECESASGDMNCDGSLNAADVPAFVLALLDPAAYQSTYPACNILNGDFTLDGQVDGADSQMFIVALP